MIVGYIIFAILGAGVVAVWLIGWGRLIFERP